MLQHSQGCTGARYVLTTSVDWSVGARKSTPINVHVRLQKGIKGPGAAHCCRPQRWRYLQIVKNTKGNFRNLSSLCTMQNKGNLI